MRRSLLMAWVAVGCSAVVVGVAAEKTKLRFTNPQVPGYGAVAEVPGAAEPPRRGMKLVFDITADGDVEKVNKGLESVARYLNLNAQAGNSVDDVHLALVLHGGATQCALNDAAYAAHTKAKANPNLPLVRLLRERGVEVFVCGQSLARNEFPVSDVADDVTVAASALTVNANKQQDGYSYVSIP